MRTANTPSENALSRSGVVLPRGTTDYHFRKLRIAAAISSQCVSRAKWPVSKKRTSASGMSRLSLGALRQEERVVLAPSRQKRRLVVAKISLEFGIQRDVVLVVAEEVELDFIRTGTG
jgi:hypothetical protein